MCGNIMVNSLSNLAARRRPLAEIAKGEHEVGDEVSILFPPQRETKGASYGDQSSRIGSLSKSEDKG